MNFDTSTYVPDQHFTMAKENHQAPPLHSTVKASICQYLQHLDTSDVNNLYQLVIQEVEKPLLESVMEHVGGNQTRAATALGISRSTLRKKLTQYGIE